MAYKLFINGNTLPASDLNTAFGTSGWTAYTPTESGMSGTHTTTAYYMQIGKTVWFHIRVTMGATMTMSTVTFSFPVAPSANVTQRDVLGSCRATDVSASKAWFGQTLVNAGPLIAPAVPTSSADNTSSPITGTIPFGVAWASGDVLTLNGFYEAA